MGELGKQEGWIETRMGSEHS